LLLFLYFYLIKIDSDFSKEKSWIINNW